MAAADRAPLPTAEVEAEVSRRKTASAIVAKPETISASWQVLVRLCQSIDYGQIIRLGMRDGEPVFDSPPTVLVDVKLDAAEGDRPELDLPEFALRDEVRRLFAQLGQLRDGTVERIECRSGIPRRIIIERRLGPRPR